MEPIFWVWLAVIALSIIFEMITFDLVSIWFAVGAIIPLILAAIGGIHIEIQIAVFVVISAILIVFVRKYAQKFLFKNMGTKTNIDSIKGQKYYLLDEAAFGKKGMLKINDVCWTAISEDGKLIEKGTLVEVVNVEGNKLIVKKASNVENDELTEENDSKQQVVDKDSDDTTIKVVDEIDKDVNLKNTDK